MSKEVNESDAPGGLYKSETEFDNHQFSQVKRIVF